MRIIKQKVVNRLGKTVWESSKEQIFWRLDRGSRVRKKLNNIRAVFHRPHPRKEVDKGSVASMRRFLENAGVKP